MSDSLRGASEAACVLWQRAGDELEQPPLGVRVAQPTQKGA